MTDRRPTDLSDRYVYLIAATEGIHRATLWSMGRDPDACGNGAIRIACDRCGAASYTYATTALDVARTAARMNRNVAVFCYDCAEPVRSDPRVDDSIRSCLYLKDA